VSDIIYRENGKEVDKWTMLMERLSDMESSVQGNSTTFGLDFAVGTISNKPGEYFLLVNYVFKGGPAAKAGIKRGDIILDYGGQAITGSNVYDIFNKTSLSLGVTGLTSDGYLDSDNVKEIPLTAVTMYEDPILMTKTFDVNGDKVGYMVYNSFDLKSAQALCDSCRKLKSAGIKKLILDLRYNGGGYVFTEDVLASLIALGRMSLAKIFSRRMSTMKSSLNLSRRAGMISMNISLAELDHY
jgi:C-terminal processing protease CtpA/Prc